MDKIVFGLARTIRRAIMGVHPPGGASRPSTKALYEALKKVRPVMEDRFGSPVLCRYSGCPDGPKASYSNSHHVFKVLEYLWDFSFSRYAIPQAIEAAQAKPISNGKFELLLVAESELGTKDEICRDLLKLLEARTSIRCLIYRQPRRLKERREFEERMVRVLHHHAYFQQSPGIWLFVGLTWGSQTIECEVYTLSDQANAIIPVKAS